MDIKNHSIFGCTVGKALATIKRHAHELGKSWRVFLELGGNDCNFNWREIAGNPGREHVPRTPLSEFQRLYQEIIQAIYNYGGKPIMLNLPPLEPNRFLNWVSKGINKNNILKWLGSVDMIYRWQEMYSLEVMLLATKMEVPIIDIRSAFLRNNRYEDYLCSDGIHPNSYGYGLISKTVYNQCLSQIQV